jgi:ATP-dependent Clp protease ATP-binding subunit ClpA
MLWICISIIIAGLMISMAIHGGDQVKARNNYNELNYEDWYIEDQKKQRRLETEEKKEKIKNCIAKGMTLTQTAESLNVSKEKIEEDFEQIGATLEREDMTRQVTGGIFARLSLEKLIEKLKATPSDISAIYFRQQSIIRAIRQELYRSVFGLVISTGSLALLLWLGITGWSESSFWVKVLVVAIDYVFLMRIVHFTESFRENGSNLKSQRRFARSQSYAKV